MFFAAATLCYGVCIALWLAHQPRLASMARRLEGLPVTTGTDVAFGWKLRWKFSKSCYWQPKIETMHLSARALLAGVRQRGEGI